MGNPDQTDAQRETRNTTKNASLEATLLRLEKSMADLNQKMDDSVTVMNKNMDEKVVILNKTIDDKMDGLREDIMSELITKVQHNEANIATNTNKIEQLQMTVNKLENLIEASSKANDLIVKGIPILSNEKPLIMYQKIAACLGMVPEQVPQVEAFRLGRKRVGAKSDPPLLFKFLNKIDRTFFYNKYFDHGNLKLSDVGINADQRIYISENLTKFNQQIFARAMRLKKDGKIYSVSTYYGVVSIKQRRGGDSVPIKLTAELDRFE
jgi:hypothetical protein